jgi:hypothetical protein
VCELLQLFVVVALGIGMALLYDGGVQLQGVPSQNELSEASANANFALWTAWLSTVCSRLVGAECTSTVGTWDAHTEIRPPPDALVHANGQDREYKDDKYVSAARREKHGDANQGSREEGSREDESATALPFVSINQAAAARRVHNMAELDKVRLGVCGGAFPASSTETRGQRRARGGAGREMAESSARPLLPPPPPPPPLFVCEDDEVGLQAICEEIYDGIRRRSMQVRCNARTHLPCGAGPLDAYPTPLSVLALALGRPSWERQCMGALLTTTSGRVPKWTWHC